MPCAHWVMCRPVIQAHWSCLASQAHWFMFTAVTTIQAICTVYLLSLLLYQHKQRQALQLLPAFQCWQLNHTRRLHHISTNLLCNHKQQRAKGKTLVTTPDRCAANTGAGKVVSRRIGVRPGSVCIIRWYAAGALCLAFCTVPAHAWLQCCENISRH